MDKATRKRLDEFKPRKIEKKPVDYKMFPQVKDLTQFPEDLTLVGYRELGRMYSEYTAQCAFMNEQVSNNYHRLDLIKRQYFAEKSRLVFITGGAYKAKVFAKVNINEDIQAFKLKILEKKAKLSWLKTILWNYKGYLRAIEFEVARRKSFVQEEIGDK